MCSKPGRYGAVQAEGDSALPLPAARPRRHKSLDAQLCRSAGGRAGENNALFIQSSSLRAAVAASAARRGGWRRRTAPDDARRSTRAAADGCRGGSEASMKGSNVESDCLRVRAFMRPAGAPPLRARDAGAPRRTRRVTSRRDRRAERTVQCGRRIPREGHRCAASGVGARAGTTALPSRGSSCKRHGTAPAGARRPRATSRCADEPQVHGSRQSHEGLVVSRRRPGAR